MVLGAFTESCGHVTVVTASASLRELPRCSMLQFPSTITVRCGWCWDPRGHVACHPAVALDSLGPTRGSLFREEPKRWVVSGGPPCDAGRGVGLCGLREAMARCIASARPCLWAPPNPHPVLPLALCPFHTHSSPGPQGQSGWGFRPGVSSSCILGCWIVLGGSYTLEC